MRCSFFNIHFTFKIFFWLHWVSAAERGIFRCGVRVLSLVVTRGFQGAWAL